MKTTLTYIFVIISCLLFGGLIGYKIGFPNKAELTSQRDRLLKTAEEYADLQTKTEQALDKCQDKEATLRMLGQACCDAAVKALDERDACRKGKGK